MCVHVCVPCVYHVIPCSHLLKLLFIKITCDKFVNYSYTDYGKK